MKNLKISKKLTTGFLIVIAMSILVGAVGILGMMRINSGSRQLYERQTRPLVDVAVAREYFQRLRSEQRNLVLATGDQEWINTIEAAIAYQDAELRDRMWAFAGTIVDANVQAAFDTAAEGFNSYMAQMDAMLSASRAGLPQDELLAMMRAATPAANIAGEGMAAMMDGRVSQASIVFNDNNALFVTMLIVIIATIIISIVIALTLSRYISGMISKPMIVLADFMKGAAETGKITLREEDKVVISALAQQKDELGQVVSSTAAFIAELNHEMDMLEHMAEGDLTISPNILSEDDKVGKALFKVVTSLNGMFGEINDAARQVSSGSQQISDGAQTLAQGSTEQAATVEELSASISEISGKTSDNAEMAGKASELAGTIKGNAEKGSRQMDDMVSAVNEISQASQSISKVIKVIDDIAFQTNILALNAAVEAARAGQHGKGFAVVADEVRTLAAKSAEAAKDTGVLISNSMEKAEYGARIANETAVSLAEIVSGINESSEIIGMIADASEVQTAGIKQINTGIDQVASVVQQNSATAEESAAAAEELNAQSNMLEQMIGRFKLKKLAGRGTSSIEGAGGSFHSPSSAHSGSYTPDPHYSNPGATGMALDSGNGKY